MEFRIYFNLSSIRIELWDVGRTEDILISTTMNIDQSISSLKYLLGEMADEYMIDVESSVVKIFGIS